jgi:3-methyladenine DNA glycosylase AlkD
MTYKELMHELKSLGSEQTRKTYKRHGVQGDLFGVSYASYGVLKKKIKMDHDLAAQLWKSGNHDARVMATMIADPSKGVPLLEEWVKDLNSYPIVDAVASFATQPVIDPKKIEFWMKNDDEWVGNFGWSLFAKLARDDPRFSDESLEKYLKIIEHDIHKAKNRVRYSMNSALISIGVRNEKMQKKALAAAARIGKVEVDHGDTDCKTPDAAQYILKTVAHQSKRKAAKSVEKETGFRATQGRLSDLEGI